MEENHFYEELKKTKEEKVSKLFDNNIDNLYKYISREVKSAYTSGLYETEFNIFKDISSEKEFFNLINMEKDKVIKYLRDKFGDKFILNIYKNTYGSNLSYLVRVRILKEDSLNIPKVADIFNTNTPVFPIILGLLTIIIFAFLLIALPA